MLVSSVPAETPVEDSRYIAPESQTPRLQSRMISFLSSGLKEGLDNRSIGES